MRKHFLATVVALAGLLLAAAADAQANHIQCGQTVTQDVRLDSDLVNCAGNGIVIGADGITVDLSGHVVDGTLFGLGNDSGINNDGGYDGVTVKNGTVQEFQFGVLMTESDRSTVSRLTVSDSLSNGIIFIRSNGCLIEKSTGARNAGGSINLLQSQGCSVEKNNLTETFADRSSGILLFQSNNNLVSKNSATGAFRAGVELGTADFNVVDKNDVFGNTDGLVVFDSNGTQVTHNNADRNFDDGIDIENASTFVAQNSASFNGDLGIEAVLGVTDGGGNRARGNGNPAQCAGVACK